MIKTIVSAVWRLEIKFGNFGGGIPRQRQIAENAKAALMKIGSESRVNAQCMRVFNINFGAIWRKSSRSNGHARQCGVIFACS